MNFLLRYGFYWKYNIKSFKYWYFSLGMVSTTRRGSSRWSTTRPTHKRSIWKNVHPTLKKYWLIYKIRWIWFDSLIFSGFPRRGRPCAKEGILKNLKITFFLRKCHVINFALLVSSRFPWKLIVSVIQCMVIQCITHSFREMNLTLCNTQIAYLTLPNMLGCVRNLNTS